LDAGVAHNESSAGCRRTGHDLEAELRGTAGTGSGYHGFGASIERWDASHRRDPHRPGSYLPRLPDGNDSLQTTSSGQVTFVIRRFDPAVSQTVALSEIKHELLPAGPLQSVYTLSAGDCHEQIYLNPTLGRLLGSAGEGVMIELTSGAGISSHYDPSLVDRARLTTGGAIGGQPCV
jgi:hypothetical protein